MRFFREVYKKLILSLSGACRSENGQTAVDYILVVALAVLVLVLALQEAGIQDVISPAFEKISDVLDSVP